MGTRTTVQSWSGVSAAWCPLQRSRLMPSRTHSSNLHVIHTCCYENIVYIPDRVIFGHPYRSTIMEWRLRRVVPASAVSTHAKPHARQQLARDLEVERAAMGRRNRPRSSGPGLLCAAARFGIVVLKNTVSQLEGFDFTPAVTTSTKMTLKTVFSFRTE